MGPSPNRGFTSPSKRNNLVIDVVDSLSPGDSGDPGLSARLLDTFTPKSRKVAKIALAERKGVLEATCQCVEEAQTSGDLRWVQHALYFMSDGYKPLKKALCLKDEFTHRLSDIRSGSDEDSNSAATGCSADAADSALADSATSEYKPKKNPTLWQALRLVRLSSSKTPRAASSSPQRSDGLIGAHHGAAREDSPGQSTWSGREPSPPRSMDKMYDVLLLAAPVKGEVQHWVWLLRVVADQYGLNNVHAILLYLGRVTKYIAPEEEWLRMLVVELTPVLAHLHDNELPRGAHSALNTVAARAMAVVDETLTAYRSHRSSRMENAGALHQAIVLLQLLARCGMGPGRQVDGLLQEQLCITAQARYRFFVSKVGGGGTAGDRAVCSVSGLAEAVENLVADVTDDVECYQDALPPGCTISLPAISCRAYCRGLWTDLERLLETRPPVDAQFFRLFRAVTELEQLTVRWAPSALGPHKAFSDEKGAPLFYRSVEAWMMGMRDTLMQFSTRILEQETWDPAAESGSVCTASLVEMFRYLCEVVETNGAILKSQPMYASLMEALLAKVVLVHISALEKICMGELPKPRGFNPLLRLSPTRRGRELGKGLFRPSGRACAVLNDLREARNRQSDLSAAMRGVVQGDWWGPAAGSKTALGEKFRLCQGQIEQRYSAMLHLLVRRMVDGLLPGLEAALNLDSDEAEGACGAPGDCLVEVMDELVQAITPSLDPRVLRRILREMWNALAGHLSDLALDTKDGAENATSTNISLTNFAPRVQRADALLKQLSQYFTAGCGPHALHIMDEPEKVLKLRKMLALFLQEDSILSV